MRDNVLACWGHFCYWPNCKLPLTKENYLCIHDITDTGQHEDVELMRPLCMRHHNQATQNARSAKRKVARLRSQGIQIGGDPDYAIEREFYGSAKRN